MDIPIPPYDMTLTEKHIEFYNRVNKKTHIYKIIENYDNSDSKCLGRKIQVVDNYLNKIKSILQSAFHLYPNNMYEYDMYIHNHMEFEKKFFEIKRKVPWNVLPITWISNKVECYSDEIALEGATYQKYDYDVSINKKWLLYYLTWLENELNNMKQFATTVSDNSKLEKDETIVCYCGGKYTNKNKSAHMKTKKHMTCEEC